MRSTKTRHKLWMILLKLHLMSILRMKNKGTQLLTLWCHPRYCYHCKSNQLNDFKWHTTSFGPKFCFDNDNKLLAMASFITDTMLQLQNSCAVETHLQCYKLISSELSKIGHSEMLTADTWPEFLKFRIRKFTRLHSDVLIMKSDKEKHTIFI